VTQPWYAAGLAFACTRCGNCCTGAPGHTYVSEAEIDRLSARLGMDRATFIATYARRVWRNGAQHVSLKDKPNHDCIFWAKGVGCTVYEDRPRQCRTWPFWRANLHTRDDWEDAARGCPGMNRGAVRTATDISAIAADDGLP
jgi:Fe-S-cluster containining protein